jgi:hypothetical protein
VAHDRGNTEGPGPFGRRTTRRSARLFWASQFPQFPQAIRQSAPLIVGMVHALAGGIAHGHHLADELRRRLRVGQPVATLAATITAPIA